MKFIGKWMHVPWDWVDRLLLTCNGRWFEHDIGSNRSWLAIVVCLDIIFMLVVL